MKLKTITANTKVNKGIFLSIGTNLNDRSENIRRALEKIKEFAKIIKLSSIYETEPVGYKDQGYFLNCVVKISTSLSPTELMIKAKEIEHQMGRSLQKRIKNGPRIIDIDILLYNDIKIKEKNLVLPHPKMHERNFVLIPLKEIEENIIHPELKTNIKTLSENINNTETVKLWI